MDNPRFRSGAQPAGMRPGRSPATARRRRLAVALHLACAALAAGGTAQADEGPQLELRLQAQQNVDSSRGPLAAADRLQPGLTSSAASTLVAEAEWRHTLHLRLGEQRLALGTNLVARSVHRPGGDADTQARVNELHATTDAGGWSLTAGKRVLGWDVGYGFRPNDVVQQEARRTLVSATPEGRPMLQAEHFEAESALSLVWVNPQHLNSASTRTWGGQESALALRGYRRDGAVDWHFFGRLGEHTRASAGLAVAWVATDETELHASWRVMQRHDGWRFASGAGNEPVAATPWAMATQGGAHQWLLGLSWTGQQQQGVMVEAWHDGTALADHDWTVWLARNRALAASPAPATARAGNLAWQTTPLDAPNLRRDNLFVRLSWQPDPWQLTLDVLLHPADRGLVTTAGLSWQGDRWKLSSSLRWLGGAAGSVVAQLPQRRQWVMTAQWAI